MTKTNRTGSHSAKVNRLPVEETTITLYIIDGYYTTCIHSAQGYAQGTAAMSRKATPIESIQVSVDGPRTVHSIVQPEDFDQSHKSRKRKRKAHPVA